MDLDRGRLARIDRKLLSALDDGESYRMVRVPVSKAVWSAWKRYCDALGISMGRAIVALLQHELRSLADHEAELPLFLPELEDRLGQRQTDLDARERTVEVRERWLRESERRIRVQLPPPQSPTAVAKVGRNDRCPCGSGLKYKRCHGE